MGERDEFLDRSRESLNRWRPPPFASPHAPVTAGSPSSSANKRMTNLAERIER